MNGCRSSIKIFFSSLICYTCFKLIIWDLDICFNANTYLDGAIICLTLPKVPAPKVANI